MSDPSQNPMVVFGDDWGRRVSTMQHIFRWVIPHRKVIWVNGIGHRKPRITGQDARRAWEKVVRRGGRGTPRVSWGDCDAPAPTRVLNPLVLPWHDRKAVFAFNRWSLLQGVRRALRRVADGQRPILITGSPPSVGVVGRLNELASIYFCMDDFRRLPDVSRDMLATLEDELLKRVDAVVATARELTRVRVPASGKSHYLPQGVNFAHFSTQQPEPPEIRALAHPRIGFAGGLYERCDLRLIRRLATEYPQGSVVLVGPVNVDVATLDLPNIHLLGPRPYASLPGYVQGFDVGIVPYRLDEETRSVDPLKLLEYLAAGLPVVTTNIPEAAKYSQWIWIAADHDAFASALHDALAADRAEVSRRGRLLASAHTWERRANEFLEIVAAVVEQRVHKAHVTMA